MSAMDTESDQVAANDDVHLGKRKRSPHQASENGQYTHAEDAEPRNKPARLERDTQPTWKRARPENASSGVESSEYVAEYAGTSQSPLLRLPVEVLQQVLCYVDPFSLARIMRVSRRLHQLLDHRQYAVVPSELNSSLPSLTPNSIWSNSRKLHNADLPHPLQSLTEVEMLRLLFGKRCEVCGRLPKESSFKLSETPWNAGPGVEGVRAIWPLKSRLCANCLRPLLLKEADLAQLGSLHLEKALFPVSLTNTLNYVMSAVLKRTSAPPGLQLTTYYLRPQVHDLSSRDSRARTSGNTAYECWLNTLDSIKQEYATEVHRLEEWDLSRKSTGDAATARFKVAGRSSASESGIHSDLHARTNPSLSGFYRPRTALSDVNGGSSSRGSGSMLYPRPNMDPPTFLPFPPRSEQRPSLQNPLPDSMVSAVPSLNTHGVKEAPGARAVQSSYDISSLKAQKRADIERRCMSLNPPISLSMLERLPAFRAAVRTLLPLNSDSWEVLKDHLLRQRESEEALTAAEQDAVSHTDSLDASTVFRVVTPPDEFMEEDLRRQALRPTREKLSDFAREFIRQHPAHGTNLTYGSAPQFAADVLLYVRRRFYEEQAREDAAYAMHRELPPDEGPSGARVRRLRLENMRYVFETAVKPLTEFVRKDLFLCNACEGRPFAFEAIIQHFASKHTDVFSRGTAVVYWKAEWPKEPPFHPTPGKEVESNDDASHPPTSSHLVQASSLQPSRMASMANTSDDRQTGWSDRATHIRHDVEPRNHYFQHASWPVDSNSVPQSRYLSHYRDHSQSTGSNSLAMDQERAYRRGPHQIPPSEGLGYYRQLADSGTQGSSHRSFSEVLDPREAERHNTLFLYNTQVSAANTQDSMGSRRAPDSFRGYRDLPDPAGPVRLTSTTERHRGYLDRTELLVQADGHPSRAIASQSRPGDPELRRLNGLDVGTSSPQSHDVRVTPSQRGATPASGLDASINAAENFLNSFGPTLVDPYGKNSSRDSPVPGLVPLESADAYRSSALMDRRSNISQPRKRGRTASDDEIYRHVPGSVVANNLIQDDRDRDDQGYTDLSYTATRQRIESLSSAGSHHTAEHRYLIPATTHMRTYDDQVSLVPEHEIRRDPHFTPVYRYVDRYGPELHIASPASPETRSPEMIRYREVRYERPPRYDEQRLREQQFEQHQHEHRRPTWDPEARRYYIQRPVREYLPETRYVQYEEMPGRNVRHEDENRRYLRQTSTRPPVDDPRYERR